MPGGRPRAEVLREAQLNVKFTEGELGDLLEHARAAGYANLAPFVRDCVLSEIARSRATGESPPPPPALVSLRRVQRLVGIRIARAARERRDLSVQTQRELASSQARTHSTRSPRNVDDAE